MKILEIQVCSECKYFEEDGWSHALFCTNKKVNINGERINSLLNGFPEWCPLENK